jgi:hypothetical protein
MGTPATTSKAQLIADAIDRARREAVQRRNANSGNIMEAYYEGMRAALAEVQAFAEKVEAA